MKKLILLLGLLVLAFQNYAQNLDSLNQNKYWVYKDRLLKHFMHVGTGPGESLPMDVIRDYINCGDFGSRRIEAGDVMAAMGAYIGMLATEHYLLRQTNDLEKLKACENELYYALQAVDRVDQFAELFFDVNASDFNKGFILRDDTREDFYQFWQASDDIQLHGSHTTSGFIPDTVITTGANPINYTNGLPWLWQNHTFPMRETNHPHFQGDPWFGLWAYKSDPNICKPVRNLTQTRTMPEVMTDNEMSQDQALGVLVGARFIQMFIGDDSLYVKPTDNDEGFYIMEKSRELADNIMEHMSNNKVRNDTFFFPIWEEQEDGSSATTGFVEMQIDSGNYIIMNPVTGLPVKRGWEAFGMSHAYKVLGQLITGETYPYAELNISKIKYLDTAQHANLGKKVVNYAGNRFLNPVFKEGVLDGELWSQVWSTIPFFYKTSVPISTPDSITYINPITGSSHTMAMTTISSIVYPTNKGLAPYTYTLVGEPSQTIDVLDDVAMQMVLRLGAATGSWNHDYFYKMAADYNFPWMELLYAAINNSSPKLSKSYYENLFSQASCDGVRKWDLAEQYDTTFDAQNNMVIDTSLYQPHAPFNKSSAFSLPNRPYSSSAWVKGDFNGMDYMLLHNLYRIVFKDSLDNEELTAGCPCSGLTSEDTLLTTLTSTWRFPEYRDFDIRTPEYITEDLWLKSNSAGDTGKIIPGGDLTICGAEVNVDKGTLIHLPSSDGTRRKELRVSNGVLALRPQSVLQVDSFSTVIIEGNSTLEYHDGTTIILDKEAVLEIRGDLDIINGGTFKIQAGANGLGYVRFVNKGDNNTFANAKITAPVGTKFVITAPYKGYKAMEVIGTLTLPEELTDTIKNCGVVLGHGAAIQALGPILMENVTVNPLEPGKMYGAGLITVGQEDVIVKSCDFNDGGRGVLAANFLGTKAPFIEQIKCTNMDCGVSGQGLFMNVQGDFTNCGSGVELYKTSVGSRIQNSKFKHGGYGIFHDAQSTGPVKMVYDNVVDNVFGVYALNGSVLIQCSTLDSNDDALYLEHSPLVSINENQKAGGNYFNNSNGHVVNGDNGAFMLDLANGHSQFKSNTNLFDGYLMNHSGLFKSGSNYYLSSSYNHWDVFPPYQYNLKYVISNVGKINAANVSLDHSDQYTSESALFTKQASLCPSYGTGSGSFAQKAAGSRYIDTDAQNITNSYYNGYTLGDVFEDINDRVYYDEDYNPGLQRTKSVFDAGLDTLSKFDEYVLGRLYRTMMECYGRIMYDDTSGIDHAGTTQELLYTLNNLIAKGNNPADTFWASQNVMITMDKAEVYRINDKRDTALLVLQDKLNYVSDADDIENINQFICIINSENAVINNQMGILDAQEYYDCYAEPDSSGTVAYFREPINEVEDEKPVLEWAPQPNPAETGMEVKFNLKSTRFVSVEVYDLVGHKIDSKPRKRFKKGVNSMHFDVHDWPTGIYFVKLNYDDYSDTKRLVIQRN